MSFVRRTLLTMSLVALVVLGCASTTDRNVLSADEQYALALDLFERGKYVDAVSAFQAFSFNYPQDPRVVDARWLTAESYFSDEDWATAAQEYLNFQRDFPRNDHAAEALYKAGRSYQRMSLRPELDQRDTERAINIYERLLSEYARSEFVDDARDRRFRLRNKLAEKVYLNAEFYYDNERYDAAEIYLVELIEKHPDSDWIPAGYALLAETFCKQGLRGRAVDVFERLQDTFPESSAASGARNRLPGECRQEQTSAAQQLEPSDGR